MEQDAMEGGRFASPESKEVPTFANLSLAAWPEPEPADGENGGGSRNSVSSTPRPLSQPRHGLEGGNEAEETECRHAGERQGPKQTRKELHGQELAAGSVGRGH